MRTILLRLAGGALTETSPFVGTATSWCLKGPTTSAARDAVDADDRGEIDSEDSSEDDDSSSSESSRLRFRLPAARARA